MNNTDTPRAARRGAPCYRQADADYNFSELLDLEDKPDLHGRGLAQVASAAARLSSWVGSVIGSVQTWWRVRTVRVALKGLSRRLAHVEHGNGLLDAATAQRSLTAYAQVLCEVEKIPQADRSAHAVMGKLSKMHARIIALQESACRPFDLAVWEPLDARYRALIPLRHDASWCGAEGDSASEFAAD